MRAIVLQRVLVVCLVFVLGRIPIPWAHSHAWLGEDELARHLAEYHGGNCDSGLACGIHFHLFGWMDDHDHGDGPRTGSMACVSDPCSMPERVSLSPAVTELERFRFAFGPGQFANDWPYTCNRLGGLQRSPQLLGRPCALSDPDCARLCVYLI